MISIIMASLLYQAGYGTIDARKFNEIHLTRDELNFSKKMQDEIIAYCTDDTQQSCLKEHFTKLIAAVNGRRLISSTMRDSRLTDDIGYKCAGKNDIGEKLNCYAGLGALSYNQAMISLGFKRMPISRASYYKIRTGMNIRDVEFILGAGEEQAYSSSRGYTAAVYTWQRGSSIISISFSDDEVIAIAQSGL